MTTIRQELGSVFRSFSTASTIAMSVVFSTFAGVLTGWWLDTRFFEGSTYPWLTILCFGFGLAGGVKNFFILSRRFADEADKAERRGQEDNIPPDQTKDVDSNIQG